MCCACVFLAVLLFFFFLMIRRPPRSTLFPTRRSSDLAFVERRDHQRRYVAGHAPAGEAVRLREERSEEHTSELQSRLHLVCRLLLEKKKNNRPRHNVIPLTWSHRSRSTQMRSHPNTVW